MQCQDGNTCIFRPYVLYWVIPETDEKLEKRLHRAVGVPGSAFDGVACAAHGILGARFLSGSGVWVMIMEFNEREKLSFCDPGGTA